MDSTPDFNDRFPIPSTNQGVYRLDWFTNEKELIRGVAQRAPNSDPYTWLTVEENQALIEKHSVGMGDCTLGVHEAFSYHPNYAGSNLEVIAALEYSRRQSSTGRWGDTPLSRMLHALGRLTHPLAAFLVLRTVPLLIRQQRPNGFWCAEPGAGGHVDYGQKLIQQNTPEEVASLRILTALKHFGFLDALLPKRTMDEG